MTVVLPYNYMNINVAMLLKPSGTEFVGIPSRSQVAANTSDKRKFQHMIGYNVYKIHDPNYHVNGII